LLKIVAATKSIGDANWAMKIASIVHFDEKEGFFFADLLILTKIQNESFPKNDHLSWFSRFLGCLLFKSSSITWKKRNYQFIPFSSIIEQENLLWKNTKKFSFFFQNWKKLKRKLKLTKSGGAERVWFSSKAALF